MDTPVDGAIDRAVEDDRRWKLEVDFSLSVLSIPLKLNVAFPLNVNADVLAPFPLSFPIVTELPFVPSPKPIAFGRVTVPG